MRVKEYFNTEFIQFSKYDNFRSIPNIRDGFKPSQRKAVYGILDRGENAGEIQVERIAAHCAAVSMYHHGAASLEMTIIGMAGAANRLSAAWCRSPRRSLWRPRSPSQSPPRP
ncbi:MAG: DNA gyrase subunit A, partial [Candidatus Woesearchaeota archaeon]